MVGVLGVGDFGFAKVEIGIFSGVKIDILELAGVEIVILVRYWRLGRFMGCYDNVEVLEVRKIHGLLFKLGLELDVFIGTALVNTYLKFRLIVEVQEVFEMGFCSWGLFFFFFFCCLWVCLVTEKIRKNE